MKKKEQNKMEMPNFIKIPILLLKKEPNKNLGEKDEYITIELRVNPFNISSYYSMTIGVDAIPAIALTVGGHTFYVDMLVDEFDKLISESDRAVKIKTETE